ncbi:hypothetical protein N9H95_03215 [Gammaproteobacteria bacterium]|nr:hypothetical protein [Gammaproteobacteria bacterium]
MIRGWTNVDLRRKLKGDLEWKLKELNKKSGKLNEEEKALQEKIIFVLNNPESDSESNVNDSPDVIYSESVSESSNSVEDSLDTLGNIVIVLGVFSGLMLIFYAMLESIFFIAIWGLAGILSALISGYVLKGLSRIISLLSSLQNTNSKKQ